MWLNIPSGGRVEHSSQQRLKLGNELFDLPTDLFIHQTSPSGVSPLSTHSLWMYIFSLSLFLKSIDKLFDSYTVYPLYFYFGDFLKFSFSFQDCQILMRVRVCCLARAWLSALGRHFIEAETSVVDSWSLFLVQKNEVRFLFLDWF